MRAAAPATLERLIRSTGFFRSKTKSIRAAAAAIVAEHAGRVPDTMEKLHGLPGVGRKTANVVLGNAFGKDEGIVVDTHVIRLSHRLRLTRQTDPEKIEHDLMKLVPRQHWTNWSHWLIWHGRRRCFARRPDCQQCEILRLCPSGKVFIRSGEARPLETDEPAKPKPRRLRVLFRAFRFFSQLFEFRLELLQVVIGKFFEVDQFISRGPESADQFVELEMNGLRVAILGVLNQEDHQEGDDGGAGVDDELPGVRKTESRTRHRPDDDDEQSADENPGASEDI